MAGKPISKREDRTIASAFHAGKSDDDIAAMLGRTPKAIKMRRQRLGLLREPGHGHGDRWSVQDDAQLSALWHSGATDNEIAKVLGRTRVSVRSRRHARRMVVAPKYQPAPVLTLRAEPEPPNDDGHVDAILAEGGFEYQAELARLWAEARRRNLAA